ncbi:MAG: HAMP domain-containing histidine kinase [Clostridia bacterium]|nr:HAMP domain-containing histidine kinase [Clostridia bacterium]
MIRKLRWKFIAAAMLSLLLVLGTLITLINILNYRTLVTEADDMLVMLSEFDGSFPLWMNEPDQKDRFDDKGRGQRRVFDGERRYQSRYFIVVLSESGEVTETNLKSIVTVDEQTAVEMAETAAKKGRETGFSGDYRYLGVPENTGTRWIFLNREVELSTFRSFLWTSIGIALAGFVMVFVLLALLSSRIVRPIAQSYEKQKRFITDAGHELKTPITIIRADADVIAEDLPDSEWLSDIRTQTDRLGTLTNELIYLSRMEEEGAKPQMMDFPLSDVVQDAAQPFSAIARTQNKALFVDVQPTLTLHGDENAIRKLVSILLDNAMKYSPEGGSIALSLKKSGRQIRLAVSNTAQNVEKGSADRLFDRFYRADASRNSETGGFGLGLAIAKAVVEAHKGKIHAWSDDGKALTVEATFAE